MKKYILFIAIFFTSSATFSILSTDDNSCLIINNTSKLDFICELKITGNYSQQDETLFLEDNTEELEECLYQTAKDEYGNAYFIFTLKFKCKAQKTTVFHAKFSKNDELFNPEIASIAFVQDSLQLKVFCQQNIPEDRYITIQYQEYKGISVSAQPISMWIKCLNQFKQNLRGCLLALFNATDYLPY